MDYSDRVTRDIIPVLGKSLLWSLALLDWFSVYFCYHTYFVLQYIVIFAKWNKSRGCGFTCAPYSSVTYILLIPRCFLLSQLNLAQSFLHSKYFSCITKDHIPCSLLISLYLENMQHIQKSEVWIIIIHMLFPSNFYMRLC